MAGTAPLGGMARSLQLGVNEVRVNVKTDDVSGDAVRGPVQHPLEEGHGLLEVICCARKHGAVCDERVDPRGCMQGMEGIGGIVNSSQALCSGEKEIVDLCYLCGGTAREPYAVAKPDLISAGLLLFLR